MHVFFFCFSCEDNNIYGVDALYIYLYKTHAAMQVLNYVMGY